MGCWGYQILCDDCALDALDELLDSADPAREIEDFLDEVLHMPDCDVDTGEYGLVAGAMVDLSINGVKEELLTDEPIEDDDWQDLFDQLQEEPLSHLRLKALAALKSIMSGSEIVELWKENEELYDTWRDNVNRIIRRLETQG